jgi:hypothetical protein
LSSWRPRLALLPLDRLERARTELQAQNISPDREGPAGGPPNSAFDFEGNSARQISSVSMKIEINRLIFEISARVTCSTCQRKNRVRDGYIRSIPICKTGRAEK